MFAERFGVRLGESATTERELLLEHTGFNEAVVAVIPYLTDQGSATFGMAPYPGSFHRRPRRDSSLVELWPWIRGRRRPWSCDAAAEAIGASPRRIRAIVRALEASGLIELHQERDPISSRWEPNLWLITDTGQALKTPPVIALGRARVGENVDLAQLRAVVDGSGLGQRGVAARVKVSPKSLKLMLAGQMPIDRITMQRITGVARG